MTVDQKIKKYFNTEWTFIDFFYAYCKANGINDPECDLDDETYNKLEKECEEKLTVQFLSGFRNVMIEQVNEIIYCAMEDLV